MADWQEQDDSEADITGWCTLLQRAAWAPAAGDTLSPALADLIDRLHEAAQARRAGAYAQDPASLVLDPAALGWWLAQREDAQFTRLLQDESLRYTAPAELDAQLAALVQRQSLATPHAARPAWRARLGQLADWLATSLGGHGRLTLASLAVLVLSVSLLLDLRSQRELQLDEPLQAEMAPREVEAQTAPDVSEAMPLPQSAPAGEAAKAAAVPPLAVLQKKAAPAQLSVAPSEPVPAAKAAPQLLERPSQPVQPSLVEPAAPASMPAPTPVAPIESAREAEVPAPPAAPAPALRAKALSAPPPPPSMAAEAARSALALRLRALLDNGELATAQALWCAARAEQTNLATQLLAVELARLRAADCTQAQ